MHFGSEDIRVILDLNRPGYSYWNSTAKSLGRSAMLRRHFEYNLQFRNYHYYQDRHDSAYIRSTTGMA